MKIQLPSYKDCLEFFNSNRKFIRIANGLFAIVALAVSLGAWIYASPVGSDPDSNFHLTTIWCASGIRENICQEEKIPEGQTDSFVLVPVGVAQANGCMPGTPGASANCTNELMSREQFAYTNKYDNYGLYPKGYYWVASKLVSNNVTDSVLKIRLMNASLFLVLVVCANLLVSKELRRGLNISLLITLIPLGIFLITSTNPSSWALIGNSTYWVFLYAFLTQKRTYKQITCGFLATVAAVMAMQSRADSAAFIVLTSVVVTLCSLSRHKALHKQIALRVLLPLSICIPAWLIFSNTTQGQAAFTGFISGNLGRDHLVVTLWNITRLPGLFAGIFGYGAAGGGLGWLDISMPELVVFGGLVVLGIFVSLFLKFKSFFEGIVITGYALMVCAIPLVIFYRDTAIVGENFQSRYILPLIPGVIGLIIAHGKLSSHVSLPVRGLIVALMSLGYTVALHTTIRRYVTGNDVLDWNLNRGREWWWTSALSPMTILWGSFVAFTFLVLREIKTNLGSQDFSSEDSNL